MEEFINNYGSYIIMALMVAVVMVIITLNNRAQRKKKIEECINSYGKPSQKKIDYEHYQSISHYFEKKKASGFYIDDITWNDLELDKIFNSINTAVSSAGEEYLYSAIRIPLLKSSELDERERIIEYLDKNPDVRGKLQANFYDMGYTRRISLADYLDRFVGLDVKLGLVRFIPSILVLATIVTLFTNVSLGILMLLGVLVFNVVFYFKEKSSIDSYFVCTAYIARIVKSSIALSEIKCDELKSYLDIFKSNAEPLKKLIGKRRYIGDPGNVSGSLGDIIMEYINMIFHIDLYMFYSSLDIVKKNIDKIEALVENVGQLETAIAIGSYRRILPYYCVPEIADKNSILAKEIYHPGLLEPIANNISDDKSVLLTGSNASGKSTFLKTIAINALFAQTIHTCMANEFCLPLVKVMSSMSLRDDLEGGDSYYMVEIKALKRIMDESYEKNDFPVMCFVDEVLRGTNTVERIAASSQILEQLNNTGAIVFAATHDIELTHILENTYSNYHFSEDVQDDDVYFSYILHKGRATSRNAIRLLGIMGYDKKVIEAAENRAENFIRTGAWS